MAIFFDIDSATLPEGTRLTDLGFTESLIYFAGDPTDLYPGYHTAGGDWVRDVQFGDAAGLYDHGSALVRVEVEMRPDDGFVVAASTPYSQLVLVRSGGSGQGMGFFIINAAGELDGGPFPPFPHVVRAQDNATVYPPVLQVSIVYGGPTIQIYANGALQRVWNQTNNTFPTDLAVPEWATGTTKTGFYSAPEPRRLRLRDNADLMQIRSVVTSRFDNLQSKAVARLETNVAGEATIAVSLETADGAVIYPAVAVPVVGGAAEVTFAPLPKDLESQQAVVRAVGLLETRTYSFLMPVTPLLYPAHIGQNTDSFDYYVPEYPFNDLARGLNWSIHGRGSILRPWMDGYFTDFDVQPSSIVGFQNNGAPTKFPDDPDLRISTALPWYVEVGDYVVDMREAPDLGVEIGSTPPGCSFTLDHYGTHLHRLRFASVDARPALIGLVRNPAAPNQGMPAVPWRLSIRKAGTDPADYWNAPFVNWLRQSGMHHLRWMSMEQNNEINYNMPADLWTWDRRVKLTDQNWVMMERAPSVPIEAIIQLHNLTGKGLWLCIPRICDETFVRGVAALIRDTLDPALPFAIAVSNEVWNSQFKQRGGYRNAGFERGLGQDSARFGADNGSYPGPWPSWIGLPWTAGDVVFFADNLWRALVDIPKIEGSTDAGDYPGDPADPDYPLDQSAWQNAHGPTGGSPDAGQPDGRWALFQRGGSATFRAHAEDMRQKWAWFVEEFGGITKFRARGGHRVVETFHAGFQGSVEEYIDWGNHCAVTDAYATGPYFGGITLQLGNSIVSQAVIDSSQVTGAARQAIWKEALLAAADDEVNRHVANAQYMAIKLLAKLIQRPLWCYECGQHMDIDFSDKTLAARGLPPVDHAQFQQDLRTLYFETLEDVYRHYFGRLASEVGGWITHFQMISGFTWFNGGATPQTLTFGASDTLYDTLNMGQFRALRDVSLEHGGVAIDPAPVGPRRRRLAAALAG